MLSSEDRKITWEELEKHNTPDDAWIGLNGNVYDITKWTKFHPGGADFLHYAAGKECTELFQSFHKLSSNSFLGSEKVPYVGELVTTKFPRYIKKSDFYPTLKKKVEDYFAKRNITDTRSITPFVFFNTVFILSGLLFSAYVSMYSNASPLVCWLFAIAAGVFHHLMMVHLAHDASHGSYGNNPIVWRYAGYIGEIISGHSMYIWIHRHVFAHHVHTNVCGVDPDIGIYMCSPKKPMFPYRQKVTIVPMWFQPFLYFLIVMQMQLDDFFSFSRGYMENTKINDIGPRKTFEFYLVKIIFFLHRLILPIMLGYRGFFWGLYLFIVSEAVGGFLFGYFSQITHVTEEMEWPSDRPINEDWATLQVRTAVDYDPDSYFWTYMSGYLNYQVPHHLFPSVAPHHYKELLPLIVETCKEFNIKYLIYGTVWESVAHHFAHLKTFQHFRERYYQKVAQDDTKKSTSVFDKVDSLVRLVAVK